MRRDPVTIAVVITYGPVQITDSVTLRNTGGVGYTDDLAPEALRRGLERYGQVLSKMLAVRLEPENKGAL